MNDGLTPQNRDVIRAILAKSACVDRALPYEVDLIIRAAIVNPELESRIEKQSVLFYEK